jgi:small subunit ribosomal protein S11
MGKKRIIKTTKEELLAETDQVDRAIRKGTEAKEEKKAKVREGRIYIYSSYNNTIITLTDNNGNVLAATSAGAIGFKGTKKSTPFAASKVAEVLVSKAMKMGVTRIQIIVSGIGAGRNSALRSLGNFDLDIYSVKDATPLPHNGCRPPRPRRK